MLFEIGRNAPCRTRAIEVMIERINTVDEFRASALALCEGLAAAELRGELVGGKAGA